jgi:hypothetical protein
VAAINVIDSLKGERNSPIPLGSDAEVCGRLYGYESRHMGRFRSFIIRCDVYDRCAKTALVREPWIARVPLLTVEVDHLC